MRPVFLLCPKCACSVWEWDWKFVFCWSALPATTARSLSLQRLSMPSSGIFSFNLPWHHALHNYVHTISYLTASCYTCLHHVKNTPQHYCNISCNNYKFNPEESNLRPLDYEPILSPLDYSLMYSLVSDNFSQLFWKFSPWE